MDDAAQPSKVLIHLHKENGWNYEENVQKWVNDICKYDCKSPSSGSSSPINEVFLQLPGDGGDDLVLGAEAKHYGHFSPRLSPICSFDNDDKEIDNSCGYAQHTVTTTVFEFPPSSDYDDADDGDREFLKKETFVEDFILSDPKPVNGSLDSQDTSSSLASSFDRPSSLAAALRADPVEVLANLGFCGHASLLQTIPARFFANESEAFGIDVSEIHMSLLLDNESESVASIEPAPSNPILTRFSESSIDLNSITSIETSSHPLNAKTRRVLFKSSRQDLPSIHLIHPDDRPLSPNSQSTSTTSGANRTKLETLQEVPEPSSRGSSFESPNAFSSFVNATMHKVRNQLEKLENTEFHRKLSDTNLSHGDTLVDEEQKNIVHACGEESNVFTQANGLKMPIPYNRSYSDKSLSSVVTVVDQKALNESVFVPIHSSEDDKTEPIKPVSPALSAENRRSLYQNSKIKHTDNVFKSDESLYKTIDQSSMLTLKYDKKRLSRSVPSLEEIRKASPNSSFSDYIRQLAAESASQVNANQSDNPDTGATSCQSDNNDGKKPQQIEPVVVEPVKSQKKNYFSAALNSLSNVFKQSDTKQSKSTEDEAEDKKADNERSTLFRLFNHQSQSTSAFSTVISGIANGEVDLDRVSQTSTTHDTVTRNHNGLSSPHVDSVTSSEECHCSGQPHPQDSRGRSVESSGCCEDQLEIKCPLGKNCSLIHKNGRHYTPCSICTANSQLTPKENGYISPKECLVCKNNRLNAHKCNHSRTSSSASTAALLTHDHFDFLVQQFTSLRTEVKDEFQAASKRENSLKMYIAEQMGEMRKAMASEFMGWVAKEMEALKKKLQDKDEEIRRLRDLLNQHENKILRDTEV